MANSQPTASTAHDEHGAPPDAVEAIVPLMPLVLPLAGGVLMLLLASIAIYMA